MNVQFERMSYSVSKSKNTGKWSKVEHISFSTTIPTSVEMQYAVLIIQNFIKQCIYSTKYRLGTLQGITVNEMQDCYCFTVDTCRDVLETDLSISKIQRIWDFEYEYDFD